MNLPLATLQKPWVGNLLAALSTLICTALGFGMQDRFDLVNIAMAYLLPVVLIALYCNRGAAILSSCLSVATFDFVFVPPQGTLNIDDIQYLLTFIVILAIAMVISNLRNNLKVQAERNLTLAITAETERVRNTLLSSISHDLRTPLSVILGSASTLANSGDAISPSERIDLANGIFIETKKLTDTVNKVLQMTRLETGAIALSKDWLSASEIVGAVLEKLEGKFGNHRISIGSLENLPMIYADATLIEQVLVNLLENALKHTPPDSFIRINVQKKSGESVISVSDNGAGIPAAQVNELFRKFHKGNPAGNSGTTGLGLAICHAIITLHEGRIWVEQSEPDGVGFFFSIPDHNCSEQFPYPNEHRS